MFTKTFELSLNRNYVGHWTMAHAIRELIQNALDSESPFVFEFIRGHVGNTVEGDTYTLSLTSEFTVLTPQTLLLGTTSKRDSADSIGSFGEGYKIALLVLTRLGYSAEIHNGQHLWRPRFRMSKQFGEELLVIDESGLPAWKKANKGLTFYVHGLTSEDVEQVRQSCLRMQNDVGEVKTTSKGDILMDRKGKLYVGSLFVCDTELEHGYNVKPEFLKLERDRQTVDGWDLKTLTRDMWVETGEMERVAKMVEKETPDVEYVRFGSTEMVKEACFKLFVAANPGKISVSSQKELDEAVKNGMPRERVYYSSPSFHSQVTSYSGYASLSAVKEIAKPTPLQELEEWYNKYRFNIHEKARAPFAELLKQAKNWKSQ